jgi:hypothetical protein
MNGHAIAAAALGYAGLGMLTSDIGQTRLAELLHARSDDRSAQAERDRAGQARRPDAARATRP